METATFESGPIFDGRAQEILNRYIDAAKNAVADEGVNRIHNRLAEVLRRDTGFYEAHIHTERQVNDLVITDTPVVYGPWLEGVGSRDYPRTRFPGYFTFRFVTQCLQHDAADIATKEFHDGGYDAELNA